MAGKKKTSCSTNLGGKLPRRIAARHASAGLRGKFASTGRHWGGPVGGYVPHRTRKGRFC